MPVETIRACKFPVTSSNDDTARTPESKRAHSMDRKRHPYWGRLPTAPTNSLANHRQPWSEADDDRMWELYPTHGTEYTAAIHPRTTHATRSAR